MTTSTNCQDQEGRAPRVHHKPTALPPVPNRGDSKLLGVHGHADTDSPRMVLQVVDARRYRTPQRIARKVVYVDLNRVLTVVQEGV